MTFPSPISIAGATFYGLPIRAILCDDEDKMLQAGYLLFFDSNTHECSSKEDAVNPVGCVSRDQIEAARKILKNLY